MWLKPLLVTLVGFYLGWRCADKYYLNSLKILNNTYFLVCLTITGVFEFKLIDLIKEFQDTRFSFLVWILLSSSFGIYIRSCDLKYFAIKNFIERTRRKDEIGKIKIYR